MRWIVYKTRQTSKMNYYLKLVYMMKKWRIDCLRAYLTKNSPMMQRLVENKVVLKNYEY
ncbi:hypothetical protein HanRHA438_Chr17g0829251 [Helianthus annuus]|nr:hypothetical protein HanRHA438_Chr17g0829251 [Helianthus annuus]